MMRFGLIVEAAYDIVRDKTIPLEDEERQNLWAEANGLMELLERNTENCANERRD